MTASPRLVQWSIWRVAWPNHDGTTKDRPALVVSSTAFNDRSGEAVFMEISTKEHPEWERFTLDATDPAFASTKLRETSHFHLEHLKRLPASRVGHPLGHLGRMTALFLSLRLKQLGARVP